jgi:hypothetical protein
MDAPLHCLVIALICMKGCAAINAQREVLEWIKENF